MRREYQGGAEVWKSSGYQITEKHLEKVVINVRTVTNNQNVREGNDWLLDVRSG